MRPDPGAGRLLRSLRLVVAPLALGAAAVAGFSPFGLYALPVASLAGLALVWRRCASARAAALAGFSFGAGLFLAGVSWVYVSLHVYGGMAAPVAALFTLAFCTILACYPAVAGALLARLPVRNDACRLLLAFPALWTASEWLRGWLFTGFPWLAIGYSQVPSSPLAGYAPLGGVFGVSLAAAALAGAGALLAEGLAARRHRDAAIAACVAVALVAAGALARQHAWTQPLPGEPLPVTLLQGNIPQELKWRPERAIATLETYRELMHEAPGRLVLLPETALPVLDVDLPKDYLDALAAGPARNGGDVLYGIAELDASGRYFNSVRSAGTAPVQTYRKHHLVPFGDYFPMRSLLGWIMQLLHIPMSDFSRGEAVQKPMRVAGQEVAVNICYEDAFGEEIIRQLPQATLLANFTNDAWWGDTIASRQHLQIAQMRAAETGRPMLRATNTGVTAVIGADGAVLATAPEFSTTSLNAEVHGYSGSTPYVRWGNLGMLALCALMLLAAVHAGLSLRRSNQD
ncbi:MAG TPA: apolipoprotein N-acyltransferase [Burkholderiales bacterium]|nr:apolipoprotein N-acyltransferase [Burkholderiales bacterium]